MELNMIKIKASTFLIISGFFLTFGAVGTIETDGPLLGSLLFGLLGLSIMGCGVLMMRQADQGDKRPVDNPTLW